MKKTRLMVVLLGLIVLTAHAQQGGGFSGSDSDVQGIGQGTIQGGGGFTGENQVVTIQQVQRFRDDTPVILQGRIIRALGNEKYLFDDDTGTIIVEIDRDRWRGLTVGPNDRVEISGEVDRNRQRVEIDVSRIRRL